MIDKSFDSPKADTEASPPEVGRGEMSRRRIIRAGLSVAPVAAVLKSNTVLAGGSGGTCIKPSAFASYKQANGKHSRWDLDSMKCGSLRPQDWCNKTYNCKYEKLSKFGFLNRTQVTVKRFVGSRVVYPDLTFNECFNDTNLSGDHQLARFLAACFAHAYQYGDANSPLTMSECKAIWQVRANGWTPVGSTTKWYYTDTMEFLSTVCS